MSIEITKVYGADVCRDGGSYSLSFEASDGNWYEFFVLVKGIESQKYFEPRLYRGGVNGGVEVKQYTLESANTFLTTLSYESSRFKELVQLVGKNGIIT